MCFSPWLQFFSLISITNNNSSKFLDKGNFNYSLEKTGEKESTELNGYIQNATDFLVGTLSDTLHANARGFKLFCYNAVIVAIIRTMCANIGFLTGG